MSRFAAAQYERSGATQFHKYVQAYIAAAAADKALEQERKDKARQLSDLITDDNEWDAFIDTIPNNATNAEIITLIDAALAARTKGNQDDTRS